MLAISNYSAVKLGLKQSVKEGKKAAPPRRAKIDGSLNVSVWESDVEAFRALVLKGEPIPVSLSSRGWTDTDGNVEHRADLMFVGGIDLGNDEDGGEDIAVGNVGAND